jgi:Zn-dependent protease with chaperone function
VSDSTIRGGYESLFFDGVSSKATPVKVSRDDKGGLTLDFGVHGGRVISAHDYSTVRPVGRSPIILRLSDGAEVHITKDKQTEEEFGDRVSQFSGIIEAIENKPSSVMAAVLAAIGVAIGIYVFGLPMLVDKLAQRVPMSIKQEIGSKGLKFLDKVMFMPTELSGEQRQRPIDAMKRLQSISTLPITAEIMTRRMRRGNEEVANAMAILPDTIIATDKLVRLLDDFELEAVLAHEMGHLVLDHGTQGLVRGSALSITTLLLFGSDPGLLQGIAINLIDLKNSRDHEREADQFALDTLTRSKRNPMALHAALKKISEGHQEAGLGGYLSSHPMSRERLREIELYSQGSAM